ncbi:MAG TPA: ATP-binding protein [Abditibacterium sp.]|jgi:signal transduction histidine kinase
MPPSTTSTQENAPLEASDWQLALRIVDTLREPLLVLDSELRVLVANRAFYQTFETSRALTEGCLLIELGNGQWDIAALRHLLQEVLPCNAIFEDFEVRHQFPGIGAKTMLLNARRLDEGPDAAPRILLAIEDISARREAEAALQSHIKKLEWSNRELQDFAHIASHDLQEPLRAIQAFGERLNLKCGADLSPEGQDYLRRVQEAAGRMRVLIHDLLAFSRVTTKAQPFSAVDLASVAQVALADLMRRVEETGGEVEIGPLPTLEADATQMRQLMQNLLDNALKFHRDDCAPRVRIYAAPGDDPDRCEWFVEDNGIGFDQKYADRIWTPFQRLHSQRKYPGTGIGLAICRKIVERHHGTVAVSSQVGQGTRFHFVMPVRQLAGDLA